MVSTVLNDLAKTKCQLKVSYLCNSYSYGLNDLAQTAIGRPKASYLPTLMANLAKHELQRIAIYPHHANPMELTRAILNMCFDLAFKAKVDTT